MEETSTRTWVAESSESVSGLRHCECRHRCKICPLSIGGWLWREFAGSWWISVIVSFFFVVQSTLIVVVRHGFRRRSQPHLVAADDALNLALTRMNIRADEAKCSVSQCQAPGEEPRKVVATLKPPEWVPQTERSEFVDAGSGWTAAAVMVVVVLA